LAKAGRRRPRRALSELITIGEYRTLDLTRFGYARLAAGWPVREENVV
jgi:hypothetical protein